MGNFLQAIGRAQPATQIRQALRDRSQDMRDNVRLGLEQRRTDAYIQSQENSAKMQAEQLKTLENKNLKDREEREKGDVNIPTESLTSMLKYPDEQGPTIIEMAENNGWIGKNPDGSKYIKRRNLADFDAARKDPTFAVKFANDRLSISREKLKEFDASVKEKTKDGKVLNPQQKQKNAESRAILLKDLEESQALSGTFEKIAEHKRKQDELAIKEKTPDMKNYETAVEQGYKGKFNEWILDVKKAGSQNITVNTGSVGKTTQNKLEDSIISGEKNIDMLTRLDDMYNPTFLEYTGKARAGLEDYLSKVGLSKGEYLQKRAKWASEVDTFTLLWRKHITGVAGGPQEMKAIEKTVINTKYDSPAKYKAKREQMEIMTRAAIAKDKAYLANGIDLSKQTPKQREIISKTDPLSNYYPTAQKGIDNLYEKFGLEK